MNFRKFISGVSALAIAASAFAGMAVTASADYSNANGVITWDFADYSADNANYALFEVVDGSTEAGAVTVGTDGITMNQTWSYGPDNGCDYVKFISPANGTLTVSYKGAKNYVRANIYKGSTRLVQGGATGTDVTTTSASVTAGEEYIIYAYGNSSKAISATITQIKIESPEGYSKTSDGTNVTRTWAFGDYTSTNTDYTSVLSIVDGDTQANAVTATWHGIEMKEAYDQGDYVNFKAPVTGTLTMSYKGAGNYVTGAIYDNGTEHKGSATGTAGNIVSYEVTAGNTYKLIVYTNNSDANKAIVGTITKLVLVSADESEKAEATLKGLKNYSDENDADYGNASVWAFDITSAKDMDGDDIQVDTIGLSIDGSAGTLSSGSFTSFTGNAVVGVVINKLMSEVKGADVSVIINGEVAETAVVE